MTHLYTENVCAVVDAVNVGAQTILVRVRANEIQPVTLRVAQSDAWITIAAHTKNSSQLRTHCSHQLLQI